MGVDDESRRCETVDAEESRGARHGSGSARPQEAPRTNDVNNGFGAKARSDLRADCEALSRSSGPTSRCVCQGMVQASAPRHGSAHALPGTLDSGAAVM